MNHVALAVAIGLVRLAALRVPPPLRHRFIREWRAELWHESRSGTSTHPGLIRAALGAFPAASSWRAPEGDEVRTGRFGPLWSFATELRLAARSLLRSPTFAVTSILTLSLGLGGTAAMYTLVDRVLLDPLPYPEAQRLVSLSNRVPGVGADDSWAMSTAQKVYYDEHARTLEASAIYHGTGANVETPDGPIRTFGWTTTSSLFDLTGARAGVGRLLDAGDDEPGTPDVVVLSPGFWESNFGGDPAVVGRTLSIHGRPFEIVGVLDQPITLPEEPGGRRAAFWTSLKIDRGGTFYNSHVYPMIARLAPGATPQQAEGEIRSLRSRLPERFPRAYSQSFFDRYGFDTRVEPFKEKVVGAVATNLWVVLGGMAVVLVLATLNVANLTAVRLEGREREIAVRSAMGAGRGVVLGHVLSESTVLVGISAILSWGLASAALSALEQLGGGGLPRVDELSTGWASVTATLVLAGCLIAGLTAWCVTRFPRLSSSDLLGSRVSVGAGGRRRGHAVLVVAQVALALALAVWGGLLARSLDRLGASDPGVRPGNLVIGRIDLTPGRYQTDTEIWQAYRTMLEEVRALPGVESAGMAQQVPLMSDFGCIVQGFEDESVYDQLEQQGRTTCAAEMATTPGYFTTMGIPVVQGRDFTELDNDAPETGSVIVSQAFVDRFWPDRDPIGQGVAPRGRTVGPFHHVVGVVGDVAGADLEAETPVAVYYPVPEHGLVEGNWNWSPVNMHLAVRLREASVATVLPQIRSIVAAVDPGAPLSNVATLDDLLARATERLRITTRLLVLAAALAMLLASVGVYGVVSHLVARRTREIGLRIAVGAAPREVQDRFVRQSLALVVVGLALGGLLAVGTARVLEGLLHDVSVADPLALAGATGVLLAVGALASWFPARRAARLDPMAALRAE